eukprot:scpid78299/ scgid26751/ 
MAKAPLLGALSALLFMCLLLGCANAFSLSGSLCPQPSCQEIYDSLYRPTGDIMPEGTFNVGGNRGLQQVSCASRGGLTGHDRTSFWGWTEIANVQAKYSCPAGWLRKLVENNGVAKHVCTRPGGNGCASAFFSKPFNGQYREIRGSLNGYKFRSPDAFHSQPGYLIDSAYVDGFSISRDSAPGVRNHVFTYAVGMDRESGSKCPCRGGTQAQPFVGDNYYCAETKYAQHPATWSLGHDDHLFDTTVSCSSTTQYQCEPVPDFHVTLDSATSDRIEVRICSDQDNSDDELGLDKLHLYVR